MVTIIGDNMGNRNSRTPHPFLWHVRTAVCVLCMAALAGISAGETFTDKDAQVLKTGDSDAVADVIYKLTDLYDAQGKAALKPAVPALIESASRELKLPEDERWNIYETLKLLSLAGDERTKPLMLLTMSMMGGGGNPFTAQAFLAIGKTTIKDIVDSLSSPVSDTRGRAAVTLHKMAEFDETGSFFSPKDRETIKKKLVANLADQEASVRMYAVIALRSFGDQSVVDTLEHIRKTDAHKDSGGTYEVRVEAAATLKLLRGETGK